MAEYLKIRITNTGVKIPGDRHLSKMTIPGVDNLEVIPLSA